MVNQWKIIHYKTEKMFVHAFVKGAAILRVRVYVIRKAARTREFYVFNWWIPKRTIYINASELDIIQFLRSFKLLIEKKN